MKKKILVEISHHGFGHASQTSLVLNEMLLRSNEPIDLVIVSAVPEWFLRERIQGSFEYIYEMTDPGLIMQNILDVDYAKSWSAYKIQHKLWPDLLAKKRMFLTDRKFDLVIANVSYVCIEAASQLGIPSVAFSSLHWADIVTTYFSEEVGVAAIVAQILQAYNLSSLFIEIVPNTSLKGLDNAQKLGPIGRVGKNVRQQIIEKFPSFSGRKIGVVSLGGGEFPMLSADWQSSDLSLFVPDFAMFAGNSYLQSIAKSGFEFLDLLASCDFVVTKPGYGLFTETVFAQRPCFYVRRQGWPEEAGLLRWLKNFVPYHEISQQQVCDGDFRLSELTEPVREPGESQLLPMQGQVASTILALMS